MKNIELLKIKDRLYWASKKHRGFIKLFHEPGFINKFAKFLCTEIGRNWLNSTASIEYKKWQEENNV